MMRLVIGQLLALVERYPPLVDGAFIIIAWVGVKLLIEYLHAEGYIAFEIPKWLSLGLIVVIFGDRAGSTRGCRNGRRARSGRDEPLTTRRRRMSLLRPRASGPTGSRWRCWSRWSSAARVSVVVAVALRRRGAPADARRRRHGVLRRRRPAVVPARRAAARRAARRDRARPAARGRRGRGPPLLPPSRHRSDRPRRAPSCATSAAAARLEGGSTLTQQLARTLFLSNVADATAARRKEAAHRAADRSAADQDADPRALPESRLPERRRLRRRDDVASTCFGKPAQRGDAAGGGADRRADPRAVGAVAVVELRRRARAQPRRAARRCASRGSSPPTQEQAARSARPRIQPYRQPSDARAG